MKIHKSKSRLASAILALGIVCPAIAADALTDWQTSCLPFQQAQQAQTGAQMGNVGSNDAYLKGVAEKNVATANPYQLANGISIGNFNCNGAVKGVFDSLLSSAGSFFGFDFGSILGGIAGAQAGNLCGSVNSAIGKTFGGMNLNCPTVNIPGFNNACHIGVSASTSGVSVSGSGALGSYSTSGNGSAGPTGATGSGSYSSTGSGSTSASSSSSLGSIASSVSCWISGTGC
jgi:hypothetical protein